MISKYELTPWVSGGGGDESEKGLLGSFRADQKDEADKSIRMPHSEKMKMTKGFSERSLKRIVTLKNNNRSNSGNVLEHFSKLADSGRRHKNMTTILKLKNNDHKSSNPEMRNFDQKVLSQKKRRIVYKAQNSNRFKITNPNSFRPDDSNGKSVSLSVFKSDPYRDSEYEYFEKFCSQIIDGRNRNGNRNRDNNPEECQQRGLFLSSQKNGHKMLDRKGEERRSHSKNLIRFLELNSSIDNGKHNEVSRVRFEQPSTQSSQNYQKVMNRLQLPNKKYESKDIFKTVDQISKRRSQKHVRLPKISVAFG